MPHREEQKWIEPRMTDGMKFSVRHFRRKSKDKQKESERKLLMDMHKKVDLLMNVMYNLVLAVVFSVLAQLINVGHVIMDGFLLDVIIGFVLEMFIAMCLPFTKWGIALAKKSGVRPGSFGFRVIVSGVTAFFFAVCMSGAMTAYSILLIQKLPMIAWLGAWKNVILPFILVAWVCALFVLPYFVKLAKMILKVPEGGGQHE